MQGPLRCMPWDAPIWNAGVDGGQFVPGSVRRHVNIWLDIILEGHPFWDALVLHMLNGVDLHDRLLREYRGPSSDWPFDVGGCPGTVVQNRIPPMFPGCVDDGARALVDHVCVS